VRENTDRREKEQRRVKERVEEGEKKIQLASFHFGTTTVDRRRTSCLGDGRDRTHAVGTKLDRPLLSPLDNYAKGVVVEGGDREATGR
jgi:hypothetical protein